jgi:hypothetical protein
MLDFYSIGNKYELGFADVARPLVIDIGCGFGVSLLGLAMSSCTSGSDSGSNIDLSQCNFLGCDLSVNKFNI